MPSSYTTSLRLTLPATGELAGQWGNTVNTGITELLDSAVAGTASISTWGGAGVAYTLSNNSGAADEARKMFIVASGSPGEAKNVICPAVSKFYVFRNDTTGGFALTLKTSGGTGIAVPAGQYKFLYCDGTDVVEMFNSAGALTLSGALTVGGTATFSSNPTFSAGTANQVQYLNGSKVLSGSANLTFDGTALTLGGNPTLSAGTANGVLYLNGSKVATSGSALTFDGQTLTNTRDTPILNLNDTAASNVALRLLSTGGITYIQSGISAGAFAPIAFTANGGGSEQMRLTSTGLGIGTSSPTTKLYVTVSAASTACAAFFNTDTANGNGLYVKAGGANSGKYALAVENAAGTSLAYLDSSGNLGIGTSSPTARLHLETTGSGIGQLARFQRTNGADAHLLRIDVDPDANLVYYDSTGASSGGHVFRAGGTDRMLLDSSGNLLVGGTSTSTIPALNKGIYLQSAANNDVIGYSVRIDDGVNFRRCSMFLDDANGVFGWDVTASTGIPNYVWRVAGGQVMYLDISGNLGLGVTPSATGASQRSLEVGGLVGIVANPASNTSSAYAHNAYYNGTNWIYKNTSVSAARYEMTGANSPGSTHAWYVAAGGTAGNTISFTQAMTLTSGGDLLVGTVASSSARLYVRGSGTTSATASFEASNSSGATRFYVQDDGTTRFFGSSGSETARITSGGDLYVGTSSAISVGGANGAHCFSTATASNWASVFQQTNASPLGVAIRYASDSNGISNEFLYCVGNTTLRASIRSNGGIANYSANDVNLSDRREKTNFAPAKSYLDTICAIPVQTFNYIDQSEDDPGLTLGVVAQDVQAVAPELVMESNWGTEDNPKMRLSIYQTDLQYALMKCIQEQQALITALTARVAALEAKP